LNRVYNTESIMNKVVLYNKKDYKVSKKIGDGGISETYLLENTESSEDKLCMKVFNPRKEFHGNIDNLEERFFHEYSSGKQLSHRNIVKIYQIGNINGFNYYIMEYCEYGNLKSLLRDTEKGRKLDLYEKIKIFIQICDGLNYIHKTGLHRDIKPDNILISAKEYFNKDIEVKIGDYGTYYDLINEDENPYTSNVDRFGSLVYISPEQKKGEQLDRRTDIYSLGIIFIQMLSDNINDYRLNSNKIIGYQFNTETSYAIKNLTRKMCEYNREHRYANISEILVDLKSRIVDKFTVLYNDNIIKFPSWLSIKENILVQKEFKGNNEYYSLNISELMLGEVKWNYHIESENDEEFSLIPTQSVIYSDLVINGWSNGIVTCINIDSGELLWEQKCSEIPIHSIPIVIKRGLWIIDEMGTLFSLNIFTGKISNRISLNAICTSSLKSFENNLVVVSNTGKVLIFDTEKLEIINEIVFDENMQKYEKKEVRHVYLNGANLLLHYKDQMYMFTNLKNSRLYKWFFYCESASWSEYSYLNVVIRGAVIDDKSIYFSTNDGALYSLDFISGSINWMIETAEEISIPSYDEEYLYFASASGYIHKVDKSSGAIVRKAAFMRYSYRENTRDFGLVLPFYNEILVFEADNVSAYSKENYNDRSLSWNDYYYNHDSEFNYEMKMPSITSNYLIIVSPNSIEAIDVNIK